jgi:hypothetical protein
MTTVETLIARQLEYELRKLDHILPNCRGLVTKLMMHHSASHSSGLH